MPEYRGCSISIFSDGKALEEYATKIENGVTTCWIQSEVGKAFQIHWRVDPNSPLQSSNSKSFHCYMDGNLIKKENNLQQHLDGHIKGARASIDTIRPFQFAALLLTDDDACEYAAASELQDIGTITIKAHRSERISESCRHSFKASTHNPVVVHEKRKKAGNHCVSLSPMEVTKARAVYKTKCLDPTPFLTVNFRYRPKEMLQALGIIPAAPKTNDLENPNEGRKRRNDIPPDHSLPTSKRSRISTQHTRMKTEQLSSIQEEIGHLVQKADAIKQLISIQERIEALTQQANSIRSEGASIKREFSPARFEQEVVDLT